MVKNCYNTDYMKKSGLQIRNFNKIVISLTVNGCAKRFMTKKFSEWYTNQLLKQLDKGNKVEQTEVKLTLTALKPIHSK